MVNKEITPKSGKAVNSTGTKTTYLMRSRTKRSTPVVSPNKSLSRTRSGTKTNPKKEIGLGRPSQNVPSDGRKTNVSSTDFGCQTNMSSQVEESNVSEGRPTVNFVIEENQRLKTQLEDILVLNESLVKQVAIQESLLKNQKIPDFQTQILNSELKAAKEEISSLKVVIDTLQGDKEELIKLQNAESTSNKISCFNCFPMLSSDRKKSKATTKNSRNWTAAEWNLPLTNRFNALTNLEETNSVVTDTTVSRQGPNLTNQQTVRGNHRTFKQMLNKRVSKSEKRKVLLLADSHGRGCSSQLQEELGVQFNVTTIFKPNAGFNEVVKEVSNHCQQLSDRDVLIVQAGSNDFYSNPINHTVKSIKPDITQFGIDELVQTAKTTNILISGIPLRFDKGSMNMNKEIKEMNHSLNAKLESLKKSGCTNIVTTKKTLFNKMDHTNHGLHFNHTGKKKLSRMFAQSIFHHLNQLKATVNTVNRPIEEQNECPTMVNEEERNTSLDVNTSVTDFKGFSTPEIDKAKSSEATGSKNLETWSWKAKPDHQGSETTATKLIRAQRFIPYPYYNSETNQYDLALIELASPITYSARVGPVCLPFVSRDWDLTGEFVKVLGWGTTEFGGPRSRVLRKVDLQIIDIQSCIDAYGSDIDPYTQLCTYRENADACQFDSGGPLLYFNSNINRYEIAGLVAYGRGCASEFPGVNTRIAPFLQWILDNTQSETYCYRSAN